MRAEDEVDAPGGSSSPVNFSHSVLQRQAAEARHWLCSGMRVWLEHGVDWDRGGYYDSLDFRTLENTCDYKRLRVLARQIYFFALGAKWQVPGAAQALKHGIAFLFSRARHPDGGYSNRFDLEGNVIDSKRDLYDLAFVLFALAHAYSFLRDEYLVSEADRLSDFITRAMRHRSEGFLEAIPHALPRRQNPHMHLLESCIAWMSCRRSDRSERLSDELVKLFHARFLKGSVVLEYFLDDLTPINPLSSIVAEPGHSFEWAWLLRKYSEYDTTLAKTAERLYYFADAHCVFRQTNMVVGHFTGAGTVHKTATRIWPQTERLKATIALQGTEAAVDAAWRGLAQFLRFDRPGVWYEHCDGLTQEFSPIALPASSLYHIGNAIEEFLSLASASQRSEV